MALRNYLAIKVLSAKNNSNPTKKTKVKLE